MTLREWATPLTIGSFTLIAATGVLMFFHLDSGLNKTAHEWLGWALLLGVVLHATANIQALKRHFQRRSALAIIATFFVALSLSFLSLPGTGGKPPHIKATEALLDSPVALVAQVAGKDTQTVLDRLNQAGIQATAERSLKQAAGGGRDEQMKALGLVFEK